MKILMPHGAGYDWDGHIVGWAPGAPVEIDDDNKKAVAWARGWVEAGAELVEDVAKPKAHAPEPKAHAPEPPKVHAPEPKKATSR